jgi:hypothetical protein
MAMNVVVFWWRKHGEMRGKCGQETTYFVVLKKGTPPTCLFFGDAKRLKTAKTVVETADDKWEGE